MTESRKGHKKVTEIRKNQKGSAENRKKHLRRKPENAILSHGNPEKLENMAETGKHNFKFAETGKVFLEAAESRKSPKRQ